MLNEHRGRVNELRTLTALKNDMETIKKNQSEVKGSPTEINNLQRISIRVDEANN